MIYDQIENLERYVELSDNFSTAAAYILMNDLTSLPLGRTVIDGENVFVNVMEIKPTQSEEKQFEAHQKYIDLQIVIEGAEMYEVALGETKETKAYNADTDTVMLDGVASLAGTLCEDRFAVFLAGEAHKPSIKARGCKKVKKAVFKILDDTISTDEESENV